MHLVLPRQNSFRVLNYQCGSLKTHIVNRIMCRNAHDSDGIELSVFQHTYFMITDLGNTVKSSFNTTNWRATGNQNVLRPPTNRLLHVFCLTADDKYINPIKV